MGSVDLATRKALAAQSESDAANGALRVTGAEAADALRNTEGLSQVFASTSAVEGVAQALAQANRFKESEEGEDEAEQVEGLQPAVTNDVPTPPGTDGDEIG